MSRQAARTFAERRLAVEEYDQDSLTLKFTAVETARADMVEDDLFRLRWGNNGRNGCGLAVKSLLHYIGFRLNGGAAEPQSNGRGSPSGEIIVRVR